MARRWLRGLVGTLVALAATEATLRWALVRPEVVASWQQRSGPAGDELGWLLNYERIGERGIFRVDPELGWVNPDRTLVQDRWQAVLGPEGLRAPVPPVTRDPLRPRIAVYGDSFGFAWDVGDDATWAAALTTAHPGLEVVNLSVPGYDLGQILLRHRRDAPVWRPDVEVLLLQDLLAQRTVLPFTMYRRPLIPAEQGVFEPVGLPIPPMAEQASEILRSPWTLRAWRMLRWQLDEEERHLGERGAPRGAALASRWVEEVRGQGRAAVVVWLTLAHELPSVGTMDARRGSIPRCPHPEAICVDTGPGLKALVEAGRPLVEGTHYSPEANAVVAGAIAEGLRRAGVAL
jgi:hypothetical protein